MTFISTSSMTILSTVFFIALVVHLILYIYILIVADKENPDLLVEKQKKEKCLDGKEATLDGADTKDAPETIQEEGSK